MGQKEAAKTVCLLKEKGVNSYDELVVLTEKLTARFGELSDSIKAAEKRMVEIGALQTHINNYAKTRVVYGAYRKAGYSKKFFEEHRDEIQLHKAAKQAFDQLPGKKIPSRKSLHEKFHQLLTEKKNLRRISPDEERYAGVPGSKTEYRAYPWHRPKREATPERSKFYPIKNDTATTGSR